MTDYGRIAPGNTSALPAIPVLARRGCQGWPEVNRAPIEARHERLVAAAARELTAIYLALKDAGDRVCVRRQRYAA